MSRLNINFVEFDPNNLPKPLWATYVPSRYRGGQFKVHARRGDATNACDAHQSKLYEWVDGRWEERAVFDRNALRLRGGRCETCRKEFDFHDTTDQNWRYRKNQGYQVFHRNHSGKLTLPVRAVELCGECVAHGAYPA